MLHFGKKFKFGKIAVEDEEDEIEDSAEQARFSPQIIAEDNSGKLPSMDFEDDEEPSEYEAPDAHTDDFSFDDTDEQEETAKDEIAPEEAVPEFDEEDAPQIESIPDGASVEKIDPKGYEEPDVQNGEPQEEELSDEEPDGENVDGSAPAYTESEPENRTNETESPAYVLTPSDSARPAELFTELRAAPLCEQVYGLYGGQMMLSCPDEETGGVYLFEDSGDWILVSPEDCAAYLRVCEAEGVFRGKTYKTNDLYYLLKEKTFPIGATVRTREEYDLAMKDGYLPFKQTARTVQMIKPMSLYRMKDLALRVEYADGKSSSDSDEYLVNFERDLIEENEGSKQFRRICKTAAEKLLHTAQPFFSLQVLKARKNLVLAFPMDGKPHVGDRFADGIISDLAFTPDGTIVMRIGSDESATLNVEEGKIARGQRLIAIN